MAEKALQEGVAVVVNEADRLIEATEQGDIETMLSVFEHAGRNLFELVPSCHKLLLEALTRGYIDVATLLLRKGAPPQCRNRSGWTPLHIAAENPAASELIKMMLDEGADINAEISVNSVADYRKEEAGDTPLHRASSKGNIEIVRILLERGADCNKTNTHVTTPLIVAVKGRWVEVTKTLLEHGADVHEYNIDPPSLWCLTPLDWAMSRLFELLGSANLCKVAHRFLSWDPNDITESIREIPSKVKLSPTGQTNLSSILTIIELLAKKGASDNIIIQMMKFCFPDEAHKVAKILIEQHGARLDVEDQRGISLMQVAACVGHYDMIKLFLDNGAAVDAPNHCGWTPMMMTLAGFRLVDINVIKLFLEYGANVNAVDDKGKTPLMIAIPGYIASPNHSQIIKFLLDNGANINQADSEGDTPLSKALSFRTRDETSDLIELILSRGADVNTKNADGCTPLHTAISKYDRVGLKIIKMILDRGANVNAMDYDGNTPLMLAITICFSTELSQLLIDYGADMTSKNANGHTMFQLAILESRTDVISQLLVNKIPFEPKDLLEDKSLSRLVIGIASFRKKEVLEIHSVIHRDDVNTLRRHMVDSYVQTYHAHCDKNCRGRVYVALREGIRNSLTEIKCAATLGSTAMIFAIVETRILDLKIKNKPVPNNHLSSVLSYRVTLNSDKTYNMICNKEIRRMRRYRLADHVSLYDVVTKDSREAAVYFRDDIVSRELLKLYQRNNRKSETQQFPIFRYLISHKIQKGLGRAKLFVAGEYCLNALLQKSMENEKQDASIFPDSPMPSSCEESNICEVNELSTPHVNPTTANLSLPVVVSDFILNLLDDEDLQNMIAADCNIQSENITQLYTEWREDLLRIM